MVNAQVVKGVEELLTERGFKPKPNERLGDAVARALSISASQAEVLLESLHDGATVDEAVHQAGIDSSVESNGELLNRMARTIGSLLGRIVR